MRVRSKRSVPRVIKVVRCIGLSMPYILDVYPFFVYDLGRPLLDQSSERDMQKGVIERTLKDISTSRPPRRVRDYSGRRLTERRHEARLRQEHLAHW